MTDVHIALTAPQRQFVFSKATNPAIVGGLGSGKSRAGTMRLLLLLIGDRGANGAYYMPTRDLLKLRALPGFEEDLNLLGLEYTVNKSDLTINIIGYGSIILRSMMHPERIIAYEVSHSVTDELDCLTKDKAELIWRKILERNRQKRDVPNTVSVVTTPDMGEKGLIFDLWVKNKKKGYELIKAPTYSNPYLPDGYIDQIRSMYTKELADLYIEGEFVNLTDKLVYYSYDNKKHGSDREIKDTDRIIHVGLDFNIGAVTSTAFIIERGNPIAVDEMTSYDTVEFCNNLSRYGNKKIIVYPDASGNNRSTNSSASDISIIKQMGFQVLAKSKNPFVRDRVNAVNGLFANGRLLVNADKCPLLDNALSTQGYDKNGQPEKGDKHPSSDDFTDNFGYFIAYKFPIIRNNIVAESMY